MSIFITYFVDLVFLYHWYARVSKFFDNSQLKLFHNYWQQRREHQSLFDYFQFHNKVFMFFIICLSAGQTFDTNFLYSNNQTGQQPFT